MGVLARDSGVFCVSFWRWWSAAAACLAFVPSDLKLRPFTMAEADPEIETLRLQLERTRLLQAAAALRERELLAALRARGAEASPVAPPFREGELVLINTPLGKKHRARVLAARGDTDLGDRAATVRYVDEGTDRVHFTTLHGYPTWRASASLGRPSPAQARAIRREFGVTKQEKEAGGCS